jgi:hypothetical protein
MYDNENYIEVCGSLFTKEEYEKIKDSGKPKIPEKLEILPNNEQYSNEILYGKINEILDYLEEIK